MSALRGAKLHVGTYRIVYYNTDTKTVELGANTFTALWCARDRFKLLSELPQCRNRRVLGIVQVMENEEPKPLNIDM